MPPLNVLLAVIFPDWLAGFFSRSPGTFIFGALLGSVISLVSVLVGSIRSRRRTRLESDETFRKLDAKKHNEHLKLIGSFSNTVGAAILGAAFIVPYIGGHTNADQVDLRWVVAGLALPLAGHIALRFMKSES